MVFQIDWLQIRLKVKGGKGGLVSGMVPEGGIIGEPPQLQQFQQLAQLQQQSQGWDNHNNPNNSNISGNRSNTNANNQNNVLKKFDFFYIF